MKPYEFFLLGLLVVESTLVATAQAPPTLEQALEARKVDTSTASLRVALNNTNAEIRGLAAVVLAQREDRTSLLTIKAVLEKAASPLERLNLSYALTILGDQDGATATKNICTDKAVREDLRLVAASRLTGPSDKDCTSSVIDLLLNTESVSIRLSALEFLKSSGGIPTDLMPALREGLEKALTDKMPEIRQSASECIGTLKLVEMGASLKRAIANESNAAVQKYMQQNLAKLS